VKINDIKRGKGAVDGTNDKRAKRAYQRAWRKANKDKVRETNKRYWMKKAQQAMKIEGE
jgi:hypothetical protein